MKRVLTCILTLTMMLALAVPACADMVWEPFGNQFYEKHYDECEYLGRQYYSNGPEGFVTLWDAPNGSSVAAQYENGEKLWIYWLYEDWGCAARWENGEETAGWVSMADMALVYDYISFSEEYADKITPYAGEFTNYNGDAAGVAFYEYPGAGTVKQYMECNDQLHVKANLTGAADRQSYIQSVFVDENGLTWGFVGYMYGRLNGWFCLDDPEGDGDPQAQTEEKPSVFPQREVAKPELTLAQAPQFPVKGYLPYILVAAVVVVTAGILMVFYKNKKKV